MLKFSPTASNFLAVSPFHLKRRRPFPLTAYLCHKACKCFSSFFLFQFSVCCPYSMCVCVSACVTHICNAVDT